VYGTPVVSTIRNEKSASRQSTSGSRVIALYAYSVEISRNLSRDISNADLRSAFHEPRLLCAPVKSGSEFLYGTALLRGSQDAFLVGSTAFLAEFEFALELLDLHLEANNPGHELVFVCLGQLPEIVSRLIALELTNEPGQEILE
jgi:hypothetical protein